MKKILYKIIDVLRYIVCTPFVLALGLITSPLSLLFGWKGFYILYIANQESCSLHKAKEILAKGDKYKIVSNSLFINGASLIVIHKNNHMSFSNESRFDDIEEYTYSPMYSHLPHNIYYDSD